MASQRLPLPTFGVTGGIGSGKSAVSAIIERSGVPVCSADLIARDLSESDPSVRRKIIALLGPKAYRPDGTYDRPSVAARIFSNRNAQRGLEAIVHPAVEREIRSRLTTIKAEGHSLAAVEAALVYEAGMDAWLDAVLLVDAPEALRNQRVIKRDGVDAASVRRRMRAQGSTAEFRRLADVIIDNDGSLEDLEPRVRFALIILRTMLLKG
ncbi:MAG: dephospho-CoA kinase [Bacteroidota bacterium]